MSNFGNDFARNFVIFGVDNSSLSHTNIRKNNFLLLHEGPSDDINNNTGVTVKKIVITLVKKRQNFAEVFMMR